MNMKTHMRKRYGKYFQSLSFIYKALRYIFPFKSTENNLRISKISHKTIANFQTTLAIKYFLNSQYPRESVLWISIRCQAR